MGRATAVAVVLALVAALGGCGRAVGDAAVGAVPASSAPPDIDAPVAIGMIDDSGRRGLTSSSAAIEVGTLTADDARNVRGAFWPAWSPKVLDSTSCATWTEQDGGEVQQGAAFRIRAGDGRVRALTVTKNVLFGVGWTFNFHTWDTARTQRFVPFGQVSLPALRIGNRSVDLPWRFCARLQGRELEFKVWPLSMGEPSWGDPRWGGTALVPPGWATPGRTGWFAGHLSPGDRARFEDLATWPGTGRPASEDGTRATQPVVVRG